jgi:hypothetical protein
MGDNQNSPVTTIRIPHVASFRNATEQIVVTGEAFQEESVF